jgi:hypothetical protein
VEGIMSGSAVGYAAAAAVCLAVASALQHQAAAREHGYRNSIQLIWRLARSRRWLTGLAAAAIGLVLHAAALNTGALVVVQPVLVMSVALALPVRSILDGVRPRAGQALAAAAMAGGVAVFVVAAHPRAGGRVPDASGAAVVIAAGVALAGVCSAIAARSRSGRVAGLTLGLAAGILYGLVGGALKAAIHAGLRDPAAVVTGWPLWTLVVLGAWAIVIHQRAYTHGPLAVSLPALSVANPLTGMAFGMLVFGETPASAPLALLGQALGLALIVVAVTMLARAPLISGRRQGSASGAGDHRDSADAAPGRRAGTPLE